MKLIWLFLVMVLCLAFAVRTLLLIDATALWSDELYSVGKSFQSSFTSMLAMLREDTHLPAYYALLWLWGHLVGQSPVGLRSLSWLAYFAGGMVMVRQAMALGHVDARVWWAQLQRSWPFAVLIRSVLRSSARATPFWFCCCLLYTSPSPRD